MLYGELSQALVENISQQLLALASLSNDPVKFLINARGDTFEAGIALYDLIQFVQPRVLTVASGSVGGAAVIAYVAPPKEDRLCLPNARFLLHQPKSSLSGDTDDLSSGAAAAADLRLTANQIIARQTGQPLEKVKTDSSRDYWLGAEEALEYGLAGRIIRSIHEAGS